ncbi:hypothetical protein [Xenorhabdus sp. KJ12.1]|uniref:hypothetical protein n=1 Tax=Xenorhabdus sp. KJ12.1 TaxID=1851571 RepID=UPI000C0456F1|nr:hypothetical protein [Xenorhabdus sp. KJ12.1]PHM65032.1 ABC transporter ATP-binding protein [Xenorhabdus sp. KJ12.1]PHM65103.1 ABC transporter ATP-binding protein [Xenorhabdus sp. KJ12.1]
MRSLFLSEAEVNQVGDFFLLLDEPDNHLDIDSRVQLAKALHQFNGSILVVSHDPDFIEEIGVNEKFSLEI